MRPVRLLIVVSAALLVLSACDKKDVEGLEDGWWLPDAAGLDASVYLPQPDAAALEPDAGSDLDASESPDADEAAADADL